MILTVCLLVSRLEAQEIKVLTEDYAPFNYLENGQVTGFSTQIVELLLEKTGVRPVRGQILLWPWKRAYQAALEEANVLLFTTTRTPQREKLFKWVGPIYPRHQWLYKLKHRTDIQINSIDQARQFKIAEIENAANYQFLVKQGFLPGKNLFSTHTWDSKIKMWLAGRTDLALYTPIEVAYRLRQIGMTYDRIEPLFLASGDQQYFLAFSKGTADALVEAFQASLDLIKKDGGYAELLKKYMR